MKSIQSRKSNQAHGAAIAALALLLAVGAVRAELPGLPTPQPPEDGSGEGARPGETRPSGPAMTGPVRGSLFRQSMNAPPPPGYHPQAGEEGEARAPQNMNLIAVAPTQQKHYHKNDVLTVVISEISDSEVNGTSSSKKTQAYDLALQNFIQLALSQSGVPAVASVNNPSSLPEIKFNYNNDRENNASQQRSDSFTARVSATVADIKPNGTLVIEAVKQIVIDKEIQVFKLSGICRAEDIQADNTILSTQLANLSVSKQTSGEVKDGTKRGWLNGWLDKFNPF